MMLRIGERIRVAYHIQLPAASALHPESSRILLHLPLVYDLHVSRIS